MRLPLIAAASLIAITPALAQTPQGHGPRDDTYRAAGTEPFWAVTIDRRTMRFEAPGERPFTVPAPQPRPSFNGHRYVTPRMTVDVTHARCSDGMSDRRYPDTVTVTIGRRTLKGCGGAPAAEHVSVIEGNWRVVSIAGQPVRGRAPLAVAFQDGRISGNGGCNGFGGDFRFQRGVLDAGPLISTRRACAEPALMRQETALTGLLGQRLSVSTNRAGRLVLTARSGRTLVLERARR